MPTHAVHLPTKKILLWGSALDQYLWDIDNETFEYVPADFTGYGCAFEQNTIIECTSEQDCYDYCDQYQNGDCPDPLVITDPLLDCVLVASAADLFCAGHTHHTNAEPLPSGQRDREFRGRRSHRHRRVRRHRHVDEYRGIRLPTPSGIHR
ncbi:MAG: hypothetical protein HC834_11035 [Rhodospirillales bacterium]|nr:hypothetical protein [Rhodospirillales bacterium]